MPPLSSIIKEVADMPPDRFGQNSIYIGIERPDGSQSGGILSQHVMPHQEVPPPWRRFMISEEWQRKSALTQVGVALKSSIGKSLNEAAEVTLESSIGKSLNEESEVTVPTGDPQWLRGMASPKGGISIKRHTFHLGKYTIRWEKTRTANVREGDDLAFFDPCDLCGTIADLVTIEFSNVPRRERRRVGFSICAGCAYDIMGQIANL